MRPQGPYVDIRGIGQVEPYPADMEMARFVLFITREPPPWVYTSEGRKLDKRLKPGVNWEEKCSKTHQDWAGKPTRS